MHTLGLMGPAEKVNLISIACVPTFLANFHGCSRSDRGDRFLLITHLLLNLKGYSWSCLCNFHGISYFCELQVSRNLIRNREKSYFVCPGSISSSLCSLPSDVGWGRLGGPWRGRGRPSSWCPRRQRTGRSRFQTGRKRRCCQPTTNRCHKK